VLDAVVLVFNETL